MHCRVQIVIAAATIVVVQVVRAAFHPKTTFPQVVILTRVMFSYVNSEVAFLLCAVRTLRTLEGRFFAAAFHLLVSAHSRFPAIPKIGLTSLVLDK